MKADGIEEKDNQSTYIGGGQSTKTSMSNRKSVSKSVAQLEEEEKIMEENENSNASIVKKLELLKDRASQEEFYNKRLIQMKHGDVVCYGNEIELIHMNSESKCHQPFRREALRYWVESN